MRHFPVLLATLLALSACGHTNTKEPPQECRDKRTGWVGEELGGNLSYVWLADKGGWTRTYRWEDVECRDLPRQ